MIVNWPVKGRSCRLRSGPRAIGQDWRSSLLPQPLLRERRTTAVQFEKGEMIKILEGEMEKDEMEK